MEYVFKGILIGLCVLLVVSFFVFCVVSRGEEIERESEKDPNCYIGRDRCFIKIDEKSFSRIVSKHYRRFYKEDSGLVTTYYDREKYFDYFDAFGPEESIVIKEVFNAQRCVVCYYLSIKYKRLRGRLCRW